MKEKMTGYFNWVMGKSNSSNEGTAELVEVNNNANNKSIRFQQFKTLFAVLMVVSLIAGSVALFIKSNSEPKDARKDQDKAVLTVELADKNLDPEKHWRNYFEEKQEQSVKDIDKRLNDLSKTQEENLEKANSRIERELVETQEKLNMARQELASASLDIRRVAKENNQKTQTPIYQGIELEEQSYDSDIELDVPKSAKNYIPEGTYFTGHLLGGIAVSTGLNTPDDNATPVAIKLIGRFVQGKKETTNLSHLNKLKLENCRIMGSSYGDLSSERAIIRLEKLICEQDGVYITSKIAGQIFGSDGLNGIKGTVIATSSKHIKNAAIGGLISGISSSAKGQDGSSMSASGVIATKTKGAKSLLSDGVLSGASNAGDKIADYYLRQAESMSPILTVPSGVRINAQITKGFFVGEISTHKKIKSARVANTNNTAGSDRQNKQTAQRLSDIKSEYME
jgi:conjugal transfer pilus assembly protein TraB